MNDSRAILFDLDGTLIDTTDLILQCFEHSWRSVCGRTHAPEALLRTFGIPLREAMQQLLEAFDPDQSHSDEVVERLLVSYREFNSANHDRLAGGFDGVGAVLHELRSRGYLIGVVSSKTRELGNRGLKLCLLDRCVDVTVFLEDTSRHKPAPDPILKALDLLKAPAALSAYVGDSPHDLVAGRSAGVQTIAAMWGPGRREDIEREKPDFFAHSTGELLHIFP